MSLEAAEQAVRDGDLDAALRYLQEQVRQGPADAKLRVFLFQLLCVLGPVGARADPAERRRRPRRAGAGDGADVPRGDPVRALRAEVFAGQRSPVIFGEPRRMAGAADRVAARDAARRRQPGGRRRCASARSRRRPRRPARSTASRSSGLPTPTCGSGRSARRSSTAATTGCRSSAWPRSISRRQPICATSSGCRRISSSSNGGESVGLIPTRYPGSEQRRRRPAAAGAQDRLERRSARRVHRPRTAAVLHRRRRAPADGRALDRARRAAPAPASGAPDA